MEDPDRRKLHSFTSSSPRASTEISSKTGMEQEMGDSSSPLLVSPMKQKPSTRRGESGKPSTPRAQGKEWSKSYGTVGGGGEGGGRTYLPTYHTQVFHHVTIPTVSSARGRQETLLPPVPKIH